MNHLHGLVFSLVTLEITAVVSLPLVRDNANLASSSIAYLELLQYVSDANMPVHILSVIRTTSVNWPPAHAQPLSRTGLTIYHIARVTAGQEPRFHLTCPERAATAHMHGRDLVRPRRLNGKV